MQGSCQVHNAIRSVPLHSALHMHRTRMQYCANQYRIIRSTLFKGTKRHTVLCSVLYWYNGTSSMADSGGVASRGLRRTRGVLGITTKYRDGEFKCSEILPFKPKCLVHTTPRALRHTVWRIELMCYCAMQSMLCRQWLTTEDNTDNHNNVCAFAHQPTHIRAWLARGRVVGATITGALWGCLVSLQVGQESSSVYAMCPLLLTLFKYNILPLCEFV